MTGYSIKTELKVLLVCYYSNHFGHHFMILNLFLISPTDPILRALVSDCTYQICLYIYNILIHKSNLVKGHIICVDKRNNR